MKRPPPVNLPDPPKTGPTEVETGEGDEEQQEASAENAFGSPDEAISVKPEEVTVRDGHTKTRSAAALAKEAMAAHPGQSTLEKADAWLASKHIPTGPADSPRLQSKLMGLEASSKSSEKAYKLAAGQ